MRRLILSLALILAALPLRAQDTDLELVLMADASGSIDPEELLLQRRGYAQAITDPDVIAAIQNTAYGSIAVTYVEWAANQAVIVDWTRIDGPEAAAIFAAQLDNPVRRALGRNAIGSALLRGKQLIEENDIEGWRRVIDFSGDSVNNWSGPSIAEARALVLAAGITINGLPLMLTDDMGRGATLEANYRDQIIGGPNAFTLPAASREDFAEAVRRKLILEISNRTPDMVLALDD
ncbi:DUF1194 domain-containing protein [Seohaeicola sp. SP36]|uniref:DUF1194 domain-containing protein n=1 Tax=unclassified Seohaeicola TaxID=2641111 RepID=UPI00237A3F07|nr:MULTISPECIES: DUF1194 domain-containing protein [unclassified Seohaeicola]MDD9708131.1 DUF1194 domain-containing protein [Seohaeicola sp. 4SK31]MDD9736095.1 DUF1194 domain-containing protein [Seohaeicola sp. SP36]MDF1707456.1 DUF1194 domain-containing protein [Paracoccaceae bacterium]